MGICRMAYLARRTGLESWYLDVWQDRSSGHYGLRLGDSPLLGFGQGWFLLGVGSLWQRSVFWYGFQYCLVLFRAIRDELLPGAGGGIGGGWSSFRRARTHTPVGRGTVGTRMGAPGGLWRETYCLIRAPGLYDDDVADTEGAIGRSFE